MRRRRYGYNQTYHGRRNGSAVLKTLVVLLALLLVAGVLFLLLVPKEYTDDGVRFRLPWITTEEEPGQNAPIDPSALIVADSPSPSPSPTPEPLAVTAALEVSAAAVTDGTAADLASQAGADALVVLVKDEEGDLAWQSDQELALDTMNGDAAFGQAVSQLAQDGQLRLVARVSAFRDLWASVYNRSLAITTGAGELWYDSGGMSWLSAARQEARDYLTALCLELAELGFDEILLERAGFPDQGRVSAIGTGDNYPAQGREETVTAFLQDLSQALEEAGATLSVLVSNGELTGESADSGVTAASLAGISGRVWTTAGTDPDVLIAALTAAGMEDAGERLVLTGEVPAELAWTGSTAALLS